MRYRSRRLLYSRWRRLARWEFWPTWAIYPPVVIYILWLGIRHRCPTLFTCVNPGMPEGGFALESKNAILSALGKNHPDIAPFTLIGENLPFEDKLSALDSFMGEAELDYPVVLKPDTGERGLGVAIIDGDRAAQRYLSNCPQDVIAQAFVSGCEFGVFYIRQPGDEAGEIFSLTEKHPQVVTGDGERDLEHLILDDPRAVCSAKFLLEKHRSHLTQIPASGEEVTVADLGTHSRGALFLDGADLITPELEKKIHQLSSAYEGFFFGRYDIKAPDAESLRAGRDLQVIELNGVTSEPTHIYDPRHGLIHAWITLCRSWRHAFSIGAANRKRGAKPVKALQLLRLSWQFKKRHRWEADQ